MYTINKCEETLFFEEIYKHDMVSTNWIADHGTATTLESKETMTMNVHEATVIYPNIDIDDDIKSIDINRLKFINIPFEHSFIEYHTEVDGDISRVGLQTIVVSPNTLFFRLYFGDIIENETTVYTPVFVKLDKLPRLYAACDRDLHPDYFCNYLNFIETDIDIMMGNAGSEYVNDKGIFCMKTPNTVNTSCRMIKEYAKFIKYFIHCITLFNSKPMYTKEVTGRIQQPSNKPRVKSKFIIINVPKVEYKEKVNSVKGAHRSPIEHERKAHSRRLRNGEMLELPQKTINEGNKGDNYSPEKKMYKLIKRPIHI